MSKVPRQQTRPSDKSCEYSVGPPLRADAEGEGATYAGERLTRPVNKTRHAGALPSAVTAVKPTAFRRAEPAAMSRQARTGDFAGRGRGTNFTTTGYGDLAFSTPFRSADCQRTARPTRPPGKLAGRLHSGSARGRNENQERRRTGGTGIEGRGDGDFSDSRRAGERHAGKVDGEDELSSITIPSTSGRLVYIGDLRGPAASPHRRASTETASTPF